MNAFPNSLREHRKRLDLKQIDVARKLGLQSSDRISHWEKGLSYPSIENLAKLCLLYKICFHELYKTLFERIDVESRSGDTLVENKIPAGVKIIEFKSSRIK